MAPLILRDEPGPLEPIPLIRFPLSRGNRRMFESLAAPVSQQLTQHAQEVGTISGAVMYASGADVDGDFARSIPGAVAEIGSQLRTAADVDPGRMYAAALESLGDLEGAGSGLAGAASGGGVGMPGGGSTFEGITWAVSGGASPAASAPGESSEPSDDGATSPEPEPVPPETEPAPPGAAAPPAPGALPVPVPEPGGGDAAPSDSEEPMI